MVTIGKGFNIDHGESLNILTVDKGKIDTVEDKSHKGVVHKDGNKTDSVYYLQSMRIHPNAIISTPTTITRPSGRYVAIAVLEYEDIEMIYVPIWSTGHIDKERMSKRTYFGTIDSHATVNVGTIRIGNNIYFDKDVYTYAQLRVELFNLIEEEYGIDRIVKDREEYIHYNGIDFFIEERYTWVEFYKELLRLTVVEQGLPVPNELVTIVDLLSSIYDIHTLNLAETKEGLGLWCIYNTVRQGEKPRYLKGKIEV